MTRRHARASYGNWRRNWRPSAPIRSLTLSGAPTPGDTGGRVGPPRSGGSGGSPPRANTAIRDKVGAESGRSGREQAGAGGGRARRPRPGDGSAVGGARDAAREHGQGRSGAVPALRAAGGG